MNFWQACTPAPACYSFFLGSRAVKATILAVGQGTPGVDAGRHSAWIHAPLNFLAALSAVALFQSPAINWSRLGAELLMPAAGPSAQLIALHMYRGNIRVI